MIIDTYTPDLLDKILKDQSLHISSVLRTMKEETESLSVLISEHGASLGPYGYQINLILQEIKDALAQCDAPVRDIMDMNSQLAEAYRTIHESDPYRTL